MFNLPDFVSLEDHELRRTISDLSFQLETATAFLKRANAELRHRRLDKREGVVKHSPPNGREPPRTH